MSLRSRRCLHHMLIIYGLIFTIAPISSATTLDLPPIPNLCASINCPPDAKLRCPEDSSVREILKPVDLLSSNAGVPLTTESLIMDDNLKPVDSNWTLEQDELYAQCCLSKKCICKTCDIPDCNVMGEVVVELMPESMDTPGQCCGQHECKLKPNCTEEVDTTYYWLENCARCLCTGGKRLCHQSCDTIAGGEAEEKHAFCQSKHSTAFYREGETWKDGCYECTCEKGEQNCMIPRCYVNCPVQRQVTLKDTCCPVCWPQGAPMPHEIGYGKTDLITTQPNTLTSSATNAELVILPSSSSSTTTTTTTTPTSSPCPAATRDLPNVVSVTESAFNDDIYIYICIIIIAFLIVLVICLLVYIRHLHIKQRSYRPVPIFEDKV